MHFVQDGHRLLRPQTVELQRLGESRWAGKDLPPVVGIVPVQINITDCPVAVVFPTWRGPETRAIWW